MIKNKKGFTLVEVIAVVVIIALLAGISIPLVSKYMNESKIKYNEELEKEFLTIVKDYYADNPEELPKGRDHSDYSDVVWLNQLQAKNYLSENLVDADGGSCYDSVGGVKFVGNDISYYACLKCDNYNNERFEECKEFMGYDACTSVGAPEINLNIKYIDVDGIEQEYTGQAVDWVTLYVYSDDVGYLKFLGNTYRPIFDNESGEYVYTILITENLTGTEKIIITNRCGQTSEVEIGKPVNIYITPEVKVSDTNTYILELNGSVDFKHTVTLINLSEVDYEYYKGTNTYCSGKLRSSENIKCENITSSGNYNLKLENEDKDIEKIVSIEVNNKIKFDLDGGTGNFEDVIKPYDSNIVLSETEPVKTDHVFMGWKSTKDGSIYSAGDVYKKNISDVLVAQWNKKSTTTSSSTIKVIFYCLNKTVEQELKVDDKFIACDDKGYNQEGWSLSNGGTKEYPTKYAVTESWINEKTSSQPIKLYAVSQAKTVKVRFNCPTVKIQEYVYGKTGQTLTAVCDKTGYYNSSWALTSGGDSYYKLGLGVQDDWIIRNSDNLNGDYFELYPVWQPKKVVVKYNCPDTNKYETFTYGVTGQKFTKTCSKTGYNQVAWTFANNGEYGVSIPVTDDWINRNYNSLNGGYFELYPKWEIKTIKVNFVCSDSSVLTQTFKYNPSGTYAIDTSTGKTTGFTKECSQSGLEQKGWSEKKDGALNYRTDSFVSNNWLLSNSSQISLYPVWHLVQTTTDKCSYDKVAPVCKLLSSCDGYGSGVTASFQCMDASSSVTIYSVFAEKGWKEDRFNSVDKITDAMGKKGTATKGNWVSSSPWWNTSNSNPPISGKTYTFYYAAIDACGNRVVFNNETNSCKF